jgi:hypothetical protein
MLIVLAFTEMTAVFLNRHRTTYSAIFDHYCTYCCYALKLASWQEAEYSYKDVCKSATCSIPLFNFVFVLLSTTQEAVVLKYCEVPGHNKYNKIQITC